MELNLGHYEDPVVGKVEAWFDNLWDQAEAFDCARSTARHPRELKGRGVRVVEGGNSACCGPTEPCC